MNKIIRDLRVLKADFIPDRMACRDGELKAIRDGLNPIMKNLVPRNIFIHGPPGAGKTCASRYVLDGLSSQIPVYPVYVNCWETSSRFKVLYTILQKLGFSVLTHRKGTPTDELLDILKSKLDKPFAVILDEVDHLDDDRIIYDILSIGGCLILVTNEETALADMDDRVRSRLASSEVVEFPGYKKEEIEEILKDRVEWGLVPGVIKSSQISWISQLSNGDSRFAIDILRIIAEEAENRDMDSIPDSLISASALKVKNNQSKSLDKLNPSQRIILEIAKERKTIDASGLFKEFMKKVKEKGLEPPGDRTYRNYLQKLVKYKFLKVSGKARWMKYSI